MTYDQWKLRSDLDAEPWRNEPNEDDEFTGLRASLSFIARHHKAEDIVQILGEVISDEGFSHAMRTGDYERAAELSIIARYLDKLNEFIENYDPTPTEKSAGAYEEYEHENKLERNWSEDNEPD